MHTHTWALKNIDADIIAAAQPAAPAVTTNKRMAMKAGADDKCD